VSTGRARFLVTTVAVYGGVVSASVGDGVQRGDGSGLVLLAVGEVQERPGQCPPWVIVDVDGVEHEPTSAYLCDLVASDCSPLSCRSYAFDLLHFQRYLATIGVEWEQTTRAEIRDYVLWLRSAPNPSRVRKSGLPLAGSLNPVTGKAYLAAGYAPRTVNHRLSVIRGFFEFHLRVGGRPLVNPVPDVGFPGERLGSHHNPLEPWPIPRRRAPYRQKVADQPPRWIPDESWTRLFAVLTTDRDRAIFTILVASGARAEELLRMRGQDVDYGRQAVRLVTKGTRDERWVATSPDSLVWLARYLAGGFASAPTEPLWCTLRGRCRPLTYWSLRAVLERANKQLGTNWVLHDARHTCAMRLASDPEVSLVDLQQHLRHQHLTTTADSYLRPRAEEVIAHVHAHYQRRQRPPDAAAANASRTSGVAAPRSGWSYDDADLNVLFGGGAE
jgi:integrase/recombinase XerC